MEGGGGAVEGGAEASPHLPRVHHPTAAERTWHIYDSKGLGFQAKVMKTLKVFTLRSKAGGGGSQWQGAVEGSAPQVTFFFFSVPLTPRVERYKGL